MKSLPILVSLLVGSGMVVGQEGDDLAGTLSPLGPPVDPPVRVDAGPTCVVDLTQRYEVRGDLTGRMEIDFRILVQGPCGSPAGTDDEEWIAHGDFEGNLDGEPVSGSFAYTAQVRSGGEVDGRMVFGDGLDGELTIGGKFSDGELRYSGVLERAAEGMGWPSG